MGKEMTDYELLEHLLELTRLDEKPTKAQVVAFSRLKNELEGRLKKSMALEERTQRLIRYLKAA